jgi:ABC-type branched-subunit amino acid transport system ATPase component
VVEEEMTIVLETHNLLKRYGGIVPTNDVSLKVQKGAATR